MPLPWVDSMRLMPSARAYAGYACATCNEPNATMRCGRCHRMWYCDRECQSQDFKGHKEICRATASWLQAEREDVVPAWKPTVFAEGAPLPSRASDAEIARFKTWCKVRLTYLRMLLGRELTGYESKTVTGIAKCVVCLATRRANGKEGDRLIPCPDNCISYCCSPEHWEAAKAQHVGPSDAADAPCPLNPNMRMSACQRGQTLVLAEDFLYAYRKDGNGGIPKFVSTLIEKGVFKPSPNWPEYLRRREVPDFQPGCLIHVVDALAQPVSFVHALASAIGADVLSRMRSLVVHVIGADLNEVQAGMAYEEILHILPSLQEFHLVLIGPDVRDADSSGQEAALACCPECTAAKRTRGTTVCGGTYHEALPLLRQQGGGARAQPDAVIAFNSGIHERRTYHKALPVLTEQGGGARAQPDAVNPSNSGLHEAEVDSWQPTLTLLSSMGTPCIFTCYNVDEAEMDARTLESAGFDIVVPPALNPFRAAKEYAEPMDVDRFYRLHNCLLVARGRGVGDANAAK